MYSYIFSYGYGNIRPLCVLWKLERNTFRTSRFVYTRGDVLACRNRFLALSEESLTVRLVPD